MRKRQIPKGATDAETGPSEAAEVIEKPKIVVVENGKRYGVCGACGKRVPTGSWARHARSHLPARLRCGTCGRAFRDAANLRRHARATHSRLRPHACPHCGRAFSRAQHLRDHVAAHAPRREHVCDACGRAARSAAALRMHRRVHDERRRHRCARCGAAFKRAGQLAAHASVHSGAREHVCACAGTSASPPRSATCFQLVDDAKTTYK
ncbi:unnamed protein product [Euphydryas editha]|uniref:C2H2-type domain-containing protein n=1 Tax=Euphydryas editha TaxID=104508 RepID=A0AAU9U6Y1_EUPED|nr:unnamed protein product [Euphydryas editha]